MAHPQIAVFARLAKGKTLPADDLWPGHPASRTMHDIRYNEKRDETVRNQSIRAGHPHLPGRRRQADDAPVRIIQGPKTMLGGDDTLEIDPCNDEI